MSVLDQHSVIARILPAGVELEVTDLTLTLDEGWAPYAQLDLTAKLPDAGERELLDLRAGILRLDLRIRQDFGTPWSLATITAEAGGDLSTLTGLFGGRPLSSFNTRYSRPWNAFGRRPSTTRQVNAVITERYFDHQAQELRLTAASGEALLQADALVADAPLDPGSTSIKDIVELLLDRQGATLQPGAADGTIEAASSIWQPGTSAWDYVAPLLQSASLRLWCDEGRRWWLTEAQPVAPGNLVLTPTGTITDLTDAMTLSGDEWVDAVVVTYRWKDGAGVDQEAFDVAGANPPRNVLQVEHTTAYPGPGAAAGILSRAQGRGRVLDTTAVSDYQATPGQATRITPPDTDTQTGYVASVQWRWPDAEMRIKSRGLVDTPDTAYLFGPTGTSYVDVPTGISYDEFEWSMA